MPLHKRIKFCQINIDMHRFLSWDPSNMVKIHDFLRAYNNLLDPRISATPIFVMGFVMGLFPLCQKAKDTYMIFEPTPYYLDPKIVYLEALVYFDFFGLNPLDFKRLTFLSFVRGFYFLLCNKRPVCGRTD